MLTNIIYLLDYSDNKNDNNVLTYNGCVVIVINTNHVNLFLSLPNLFVLEQRSF